MLGPRRSPVRGWSRPLAGPSGSSRRTRARRRGGRSSRRWRLHWPRGAGRPGAPERPGQREGYQRQHAIRASISKSSSKLSRRRSARAELEELASRPVDDRLVAAVQEVDDDRNRHAGRPTSIADIQNAQASEFMRCVGLSSGYVRCMMETGVSSPNEAVRMSADVAPRGAADARAWPIRGKKFTTTTLMWPHHPRRGSGRDRSRQGRQHCPKPPPH